MKETAMDGQPRQCPRCGAPTYGTTDARHHSFACPGRNAAYALREAAGEVLATSGFKDRLDHKDLAVLRRAVREYDSSPAT